MIYFATCGRGFEKFVQEELIKLQIIHDVLHIAEGKLLFSVCSCDNCDICLKKQSLSDVISNNGMKNYYCQNFDFKFKSKILLDSELKSILKLKLIEKVYFLLLYQPIHLDQYIIGNITVSQLMALVNEINFSSCLTMANLLDGIKQKQPIWQMCIDPKTCPAAHSRQIEKQRRWKRTKGNNSICLLKDNATTTETLYCSQAPQQLELEKKLSHYALDNKSCDFHSSVSQLPVLTAESDTPSKFSNVISSAYPSFRVSCRIRGLWKKNFKPNILIHNLLSQLQKMGIGSWNEHNPLLDIYVNLNDEQILIGASLSGKPLSLRSYIPHITLRSTVCYLLVQFSSIGNDETLLDPMCGAGTILLEAFMNRKNLRIIAGDQNYSQLQVARCNLRGIANAEYLMVNAENIPLRNESVDAVICDFPFGKKYVTEKPLENLLISVLKETSRIIKANRRTVFLLSKNQKCFIDELISKKDLAADWGIVFKSQHHISLGLTPAFIFVFSKVGQS